AEQERAALHDHAAAAVAARDGVGAPAAEDRAGEAAALREEARREAGEGEVLFEMIVDVRRHPEEEDGGDGVRADEGEEQRDRRGRRQDRAQRRGEASLGVARAALRLADEELQDDAEEDAGE